MSTQKSNKPEYEYIPVGEHETTKKDRISATISDSIFYIIGLFICLIFFSGKFKIICIIVCSVIFAFVIYREWTRKTTTDYKKVLKENTSTPTKSNSANVEVQLKCSNEHKTHKLGQFNKTYSTTVFLNAYKKSAVLDEDKYYRYVYTELGIKNPVEFHKELITNDYLVSDIKSGKYVLSDKGKKYLKENNECCLVHKYRSKWDIDWKKYKSAKNKLNFEANFTDVMWSIFLERQAKKKNLDSWTYINMYQLLLLDNKKEQAIIELLKYYYLEFNNITAFDDYLRYRKGEYNSAIKENIMDKNMALPFFFSLTNVNTLLELSEYINDSVIEKVCNSFPNYPIKICSKFEFKKYINQILSGTFSEEKATKELDEKWKQFIKNI